MTLKKKFNVSSTEMEILQWLWEEDRKITSRETWKKQTLNTFLSRLLKKGLLETESIGNKFLYYPALSRQDYEQCKARDFLEKLYSGSIRNFVAALSGGERLNKKESDEIRELLDE